MEIENLKQELFHQAIINILMKAYCNLKETPFWCLMTGSQVLLMNYETQ